MKEYEIHPCEIVGVDSKGYEIMEQCSEESDNIACWSLYEHIYGKGLEWIEDFKTKPEAQVKMLSLSLSECTEKLKEKRAFITTMYRYGNRELHSYVLGVWSTREKAMQAGETEALWRGGKYEPEVTPWVIDANEFDNIE